MSRLARELSVLDGDNIHSMLASEEAVDNLMDLLTTALKEIVFSMQLITGPGFDLAFFTCKDSDLFFFPRLFLYLNDNFSHFCPFPRFFQLKIKMLIHLLSS